MVKARKPTIQWKPCGIIRITALWVLCRYRHKSHWTGAKHRLDRTFGNRFGDHAYAIEELTAELGAAFLCADLGISASPREDHACYINNWLSAMKADAKTVFAAASAASKAMEYLQELE